METCMHTNSSVMEIQKAYKYKTFSTVDLSSIVDELKEYKNKNHTNYEFIINITSKFIIQNATIMTILLHLNWVKWPWQWSYLTSISVLRTTTFLFSIQRDCCLYLFSVMLRKIRRNQKNCWNQHAEIKSCK